MRISNVRYLRVDAVFILRQMIEKSIEYNKPSYLCIMALKKAFYRYYIPVNTTQMIEDGYSNNKVQAGINNKLI